MVVIHSLKFSCQTCITGHRSTTCNHTARQLIEIRPKGRPITQCPKCRELRKGKGIHAKCKCSPEEIPTEQHQQQKRDPIILPNGAADAEGDGNIFDKLGLSIAEKALDNNNATVATKDSSSKKQLSVISTPNPCRCIKTGKCLCGSAPKVRKRKSLAQKEDVDVSNKSEAGGSCCRRAKRAATNSTQDSQLMSPLQTRSVTSKPTSLTTSANGSQREMVDAETMTPRKWMDASTRTTIEPLRSTCCGSGDDRGPHESSGASSAIAYSTSSTAPSASSSCCQGQSSVVKQHQDPFLNLNMSSSSSGEASKLSLFDVPSEPSLASSCWCGDRCMCPGCLIHDPFGLKLANGKGREGCGGATKTDNNTQSMSSSPPSLQQSLLSFLSQQPNNPEISGTGLIDQSCTQANLNPDSAHVPSSISTTLLPRDSRVAVDSIDSCPDRCWRFFEPPSLGAPHRTLDDLGDLDLSMQPPSYQNQHQQRQQPMSTTTFSIGEWAAAMHATHNNNNNCNQPLPVSLPPEIQAALLCSSTSNPTLSSSSFPPPLTPDLSFQQSLFLPLTSFHTQSQCAIHSLTTQKQPWSDQQLNFPGQEDDNDYEGDNTLYANECCCGDDCTCGEP